MLWREYRLFHICIKSQERIQDLKKEGAGVCGHAHVSDMII